GRDVAAAGARAAPARAAAGAVRRRARSAPRAAVPGQVGAPGRVSVRASAGAARGLRPDPCLVGDAREGDDRRVHAERPRRLGGLLRPRARRGRSRPGHGRPHRVRLRPLHYGAERLGCTVVPASGGNTPRQAQLLEDLGAEIRCCTPSYALAIADHISEPARLNLRAGLFGAEPWTEGLREAIEHAFDLAALDIYGLSEIIGPGV